MEFGEVIKKLKGSLGELEKNAEAIPDAILKFRRALKAACLDQLVRKVKSELEHLEQRGEDVEDIRVNVLYRGKTYLVSYSRNGLLALMTLNVKDFHKVIEETKKLIIEGSDLDPFYLVKEMTDAKILPFYRVKALRKRGGS